MWDERSNLIKSPTSWSHNCANFARVHSAVKYRVMAGASLNFIKVLSHQATKISKKWIDSDFSRYCQSWCEGRRLNSDSLKLSHSDNLLLCTMHQISRLSLLKPPASLSKKILIENCLIAAVEPRVRMEIMTQEQQDKQQKIRLLLTQIHALP